MNIEILVEKINLYPEAYQAYKRFNLDDSEYKRLKELFYIKEEEFFSQVEQIYSKPYQAYLYLYLRFAVDCYHVYREKRIKDEIYFDTMQDFTVWTKNCFLETGEWGLKEVYWLKEHLKLKLFKIGRLQFQPRKYTRKMFETPLIINGAPLPENADICFVHIPEGAPLLEEQVNKSYLLAKAFFKRDFIFLCDSWLLSPVLKEILKPDSNILRFQERYKIISVNKESDSISRYLLNSDSSLARAIKQKNLQIGTALGYLMQA